MKKVCSVILAAAVTVEGVSIAEHLRPALMQQDPAAAAAAAASERQTPDGFPALPEVSTMLGTASHTLESLSKQAATLQAQVQAAEKEKAQKMAKQKASFEAKLKAQELGNRALVSQNKQISGHIEVLKKGNIDLRKQSEALEETNAIMREELSALQGRIGTAQGFVVKALKKTDDSGAKDLLVLESEADTAVASATQRSAIAPQPEAAAEPPHLEKPAASKHSSSSLAAAAAKTGAAHVVAETDQDADEDDDEDGDDEQKPEQKPVSLLVIGEERHVEATGDATPEEAEAKTMIKVLKQSVSQLSAQEQASEAQLKALFARSFKAGKNRHHSLVVNQQALNTSQADLLTLQGQLQTARSHLQATQQTLHQRLSKVGSFLQKLAHLALAPTAEAPRLEKALPEAPGITSTPAVVMPAAATP